MYSKFNVQGWVPEEAQSLGCGRSESETYNCETEEQAIFFFLKDHPTAKKENLKVYKL